MASALQITRPRKSAGANSLRPLERSFYDRDPRRVARELLGKILVRNAGQDAPVRLTARIVEVEAYMGYKDPASHSFSGQTLRNAVLFGPPGYAYVYFIYGNHYCLNVSCEPDGKPGGVLFRAVEPLSGIDEMARARGIKVNGPADLPKLTSGPGRMAEAFGITRNRDNGCDLTSARSSLWIGENWIGKESIGEDSSGKRNFPMRIRATPRIGIVKAADRQLRYILEGNPFVSGPKTWPKLVQKEKAGIKSAAKG